MLLYHGSNMKVIEPRLLDQMRGLDFGPGFYTTSSELQAKRFARIVCDRREAGAPFVSVFEYNMDEAKRTLEVRRFDGIDEKWFQFVVDNRSNAYKGKPFDIVIGPVADDRVMPTIQAYMGGFLSKKNAMSELRADRLVDQVCLKTEKALSLLSFIRTFEVEGGE